MYDQGDFIQRAIGLGYHEIVVMAHREATEAERGTSKVKGSVRKRNAGALEYAAFLKGVIFFLQSGTKPLGLSDQQFMSIRPLAVDLVKRGIFDQKILDAFQQK
ncbi:hypothetical protein M5G20_05445 [Pseudomonas sp. TNT2022 ID1044]|uniref:hypothetical protein n=1 Tax=Pseudomonas sp. TNT2022 ID1044 TaxID=2942636 RepID=UPI0023611CED|nr:hypothetical protein [Pseudomonas sp. TNT2022 ID1044]MDD0995312.1 hypothetical protein [Pseudomonas sp. TNT2022 ID1044]